MPERDRAGGALIRRRELAVVAALLLVTIAVYAPVARHDFIHFDDGVFVYANPQVLGGLSRDGVAYAFTSWEHRIWAPLTFLSHMADVSLFGIDGSLLGLPASGWHHLSNLGLHLTGTALLYLLLRTATGAPWRSALVAALFALHPFHVESVAWIAERKTLLSTVFGWLCLLAYVGYARRPALARYLLVLALLALGLMSKPMLVTWPFLMLLLDWWPLGRLSRASAGRLVLEKLPLLALVAASSVVTFLAQRPAMHLMGVVPLGQRLQNAAVACLSYVAKSFWPTDLAVLYPYRPAIPVPLTVAAVAFVAAASVFALRAARLRPHVFVGWFWFLGTLVPVLGIVQVGVHSMADRYTYVPQVGLFVAAVWGAAELVARRPAAGRLAAPVGGALLAGCAAVSAVQVGHWADTESLFRHTCGATRENGWAHRILGTALSEKGRLDEAVHELGIALRQWPDDPAAHNNLGVALARLGRPEEALREYREAVRLDPGEPDYRANLGGALLKSGQVAGAIAEFREAVRLQPGSAAAHANLGRALALDGRFDEAIEELRESLRLQPDEAAVQHALGVALERRGDVGPAIDALRAALRLEPDSAEILTELAELLATCPDPARRDG
ncbi:MAG TPA: tetratricopeptide repeat protein, partial [Planctomycetota bacterium]|nr:tetratricopeptide repeat protein [Planctomycetota bacterium]